MSTSCVLETKREYFDPAPCRVPSPDSNPISHVHDHHHHHHHHNLNNNTQFHHLHHHNGNHHCGPSDELEHQISTHPIQPATSFYAPELVAVVYEQPKARAALFCHQSPSSPTSLTSFKAAPSDQSSGGGGRRRRSSGHNSLESLQSRLSSSSATYDLEEVQREQPTSQQQRVPPSPPHPVKPPKLPAAAASQHDHPEHQNPCEPQHHQSPLSPAQIGLSAASLALLQRRTLKTTTAAAAAAAGGHQPQKFNRADQQRQTSPIFDDCRLSSPHQLQTGTKSASLKLTGNNLGEKLAKLANDTERPAGGGRRKSSQCSITSNASSKAQIGKRKAPFMFAGILASILGSIFFSFGILTIKLLPDGHGLAEKTQIACWRGVIMMLLCSMAIIKSKCGFLVPRDEIFINLLRSVFGFFGIYMSYIALKYISMGDATALVFSSPVWTSLLSHYILHEPLQWIQLLALPLSLLGIVLIAHPSLIVNIEHKSGSLERQPVLDPAEVLQRVVNGTNSTSLLLADELALNQDLDIALNASEHFDYEHRWKGIVIALACSFVVSMVYIVLKFRKSTPIQTATFWLALTTFSGALIMSTFTGLGSFPASWFELTLLVGNGFTSWLGQCLLQWALTYEDASVLSVVRTLDVAMSFSLSAIFLEEEILWTSILGATIIATVVVSIMLSSYIQSRLCPTINLDGDNMEQDNNDQTDYAQPAKFSISSFESNNLDNLSKTRSRISSVHFRVPLEQTGKSVSKQGKHLSQTPFNQIESTVGA